MIDTDLKLCFNSSGEYINANMTGEYETLYLPIELPNYSKIYFVKNKE